ncbi:hypothetical protein SEET535_15220, partial [Salmonella enterica subsp. enterica serovar Tennessee str. 4535]
MAFSCIKASPEKRGLFTLQVCSSHYWYTDYDYATAIPADAGNTCSAITGRFSRSVYPRWRGEHHYKLHPKHLRCGLSPLARGTHLRDVTKKTIIRFIPAGAGNTGYHVGQLPRRTVYPRWRGEHLPAMLQHPCSRGLYMS